MAKKSTYVSAISPEYALLGFLTLAPGHGYDLHQRLLSELGSIWHIRQSQLYTILKRLEQQGDIAGVRLEQVGLPDRRVFQITEAGRARFETWLATPSGCSVRAIRVEFITRLYFLNLRGSDLAQQMLAAQIETIRECLEELRRRYQEQAEEQVFPRIGLDLRIRQLASVLEWLQECRGALEQIKKT